MLATAAYFLSKCSLGARLPEGLLSSTLKDDSDVTLVVCEPHENRRPAPPTYILVGQSCTQLSLSKLTAAVVLRAVLRRSRPQCARIVSWTSEMQKCWTVSSSTRSTAPLSALLIPAGIPHLCSLCVLLRESSSRQRGLKMPGTSFEETYTFSSPMPRRRNVPC